MKITDKHQKDIQRKIKKIDLDATVIFITVLLLPMYFSYFGIFLILGILYFIITQFFHTASAPTQFTRIVFTSLQEFHLQLKISIKKNAEWIFILFIWFIMCTFLEKFPLIEFITPFIFLSGLYFILLVCTKCVVLFINKIRLKSFGIKLSKKRLDSNQIQTLESVHRVQQDLSENVRLTPVTETDRTPAYLLYDTFSLQLQRLQQDVSQILNVGHLQQLVHIRHTLLDLQKSTQSQPMTQQQYQQIFKQLRKTFRQLNQTIEQYLSYSIPQQQDMNLDVIHSPDDWLTLQMQCIEQELYDKIAVIYQNELNQFLQHQQFIQESFNSEPSFKVEKFQSK